MGQTPQRAKPQATDVTRPFWQAAADHRLVIQECSQCKARQLYPRNLCISCASESLNWLECSGKGTVYTFTINHRAPNEFMKARVPYAVAAIDLDEGVRMLANIIDSPLNQIAIGSRVSVVFETIDEEYTLPQFKLGA